MDPIKIPIDAPYTLHTVYKAGGEGVPNFAIVANTAIPKDADVTPEGVPFSTFEYNWRSFYDEQARKILTVLLCSLPGGTIDALLVQLLDHKRSISFFRVTHDPGWPNISAEEKEAIDELLRFARLAETRRAFPDVADRIRDRLQAILRIREMRSDER